jgi:hypothetical protein
MAVPLTDLTIRFFTSYPVLFCTVHFMYIRCISTYITWLVCMYEFCVCVWGGGGEVVCTGNLQNNKTPTRNSQILRIVTVGCRLTELWNTTGVSVSCLSIEFSYHWVLDTTVFTGLALKDPIASLQIMKRKFPAPGRARTPVMQTIIKVEGKVSLCLIMHDSLKD